MARYQKVMPYGSIKPDAQGFPLEQDQHIIAKCFTAPEGFHIP